MQTGTTEPDLIIQSTINDKNQYVILKEYVIQSSGKIIIAFYL